MRNMKAGLLIALVVFIWLASGFFIYHVFPISERGSIGDMFGAVNALFSGLALAGVAYAIFLQQQELSLQRRDLELTREELGRAATAHENSERHSEQQASALQYTAILNALTALIQGVERELRTPPSTDGNSPDHAKRAVLRIQMERYEKELQRLLHRFAEKNPGFFSSDFLRQTL